MYFFVFFLSRPSDPCEFYCHRAWLRRFYLSCVSTGVLLLPTMANKFAFCFFVFIYIYSYYSPKHQFSLKLYTSIERIAWLLHKCHRIERPSHVFAFLKIKRNRIELAIDLVLLVLVLFYLIVYCSKLYEDEMAIPPIFPVCSTISLLINATAMAMPISYSTLYFSTDEQIKYAHSIHIFRRNRINCILVACACISTNGNHKIDRLLVGIFTVFFLNETFIFVLRLRMTFKDWFTMP